MISKSRHLFAIPDEVAYFNLAYMSPSLRAAETAGIQGMRRKRSPWTLKRADFFDEVEEVRSLFAQLIGASAEDIALVPSASYGAAVAGANIPLHAGQKVLVLDAEHASNTFVWMRKCREAGAEIITVPRVAGSDWTSEVLKRVDRHVALVACPNCHWFDGSYIDLEEVGRAARAVGAALVVDGTQSIGAIDFDVGRIRPDFAICAAYKWLLGPYGLTFVYVDPAYQAGETLEHHVYNRIGADKVASSTTYVEEFMSGARRYDVGERSNFILLPMAIAGLRQLLDWGVNNITGHLASITREIEQRGVAAGLERTANGAGSPHMTGLRFPNGVPDILAGRLAAAGVHISVRRDILRVSPYLYNNAHDIDRLIDVLASISEETPAHG